MPIGWRADNQSLYVRPRRAGDMSTPVWIVDIATGKRTLWKEIRPSQPIDFRYDLHLHITPDGRAYAYNFSLQLVRSVPGARAALSFASPQRYLAGVYYQA